MPPPLIHLTPAKPGRESLSVEWTGCGMTALPSICGDLAPTLTTLTVGETAQPPSYQQMTSLGGSLSCLEYGILGGEDRQGPPSTGSYGETSSGRRNQESLPRRGGT